MADLSRFEQYYKLADALIALASKEQVAECARLLALNLAHYQALYGLVELDEPLISSEAAEPNEQQAQLLADGMEILFGVMGNIAGAPGQETH